MFYITISNGLLAPEHRKKMAIAVWEFMWCLDRVTTIDKNGTGWVLRGKPVNLDDIAEELGTHHTTVSRNLTRLTDEKYLVLKHAPYGIIIGVNKAKKSLSHPKSTGLSPVPKKALTEFSEMKKKLTEKMRRTATD